MLVSSIKRKEDGMSCHVRSGSIDALAKLLGTVIFIEEIVSDLLQVGEMTVQQSTTNGQEIRVSRVLNLDHTPRVLPCAYFSVLNLHEVFRSDDSERHQPTQFGILFHSILIILLDVVGEVVHGDTVVLNVLHNQLLGFGQFGRSQGIGLSNDGNNIDTGRESLHQFYVQFTQTVAGWCDEIQENVHTVVPEAGVTLNS